MTTSHSDPNKPAPAPRSFSLSSARRVMPAAAALALALVLSISFPFLSASAEPAPSSSGSASAPEPPADPISAAAFAGNSKAPPDEAWKTARPLSGVRIGRDAKDNKCVVKHVAEWVRVSCAGLDSGRVDLIAGEARDLSILVATTKEPSVLFGDDMQVQFSMRPGDRRIIQWLETDVWWEVWGGGTMASGLRVIGPMFGVMLQVDWTEGSEPTIALF